MLPSDWGKWDSSYAEVFLRTMRDRLEDPNYKFELYGGIKVSPVSAEDAAKWTRFIEIDKTL